MGVIRTVGLARMSLSGAALILGVLLIRALGSRRLPRRCFPALWAVALARLLLPFSVALPVSLPTPAGPVPPALGTVSSLRAEPAPLPLLALLWGAGAAVLAARFLVSYLRCRRAFRAALPVRDRFVTRWLEEHPLRRRIRVRQLPGLSTPLTYGALRPVILVPAGLDWTRRRQGEYILYHEYVHIRRLDSLLKGAAALALCVHWFDPFVWALYLLLDRDVELACDEQVLRHFGQRSRKDYAMTLLRLEERRGRLSAFPSCLSKNTTEERILAIMKWKKKTVAALIVAALLVTAGAITAFAAISDPPADPASPAADTPATAEPADPTQTPAVLYHEVDNGGAQEPVRVRVVTRDGVTTETIASDAPMVAEYAYDDAPTDWDDAPADQPDLTWTPTDEGSGLLDRQPVAEYSIRDLPVAATGQLVAVPADQFSAPEEEPVTVSYQVEGDATVQKVTVRTQDGSSLQDAMASGNLVLEYALPD